MATLPALTKTYSTRGNTPFASSASTLACSQSMLFNLMQHLVNTASGGTTSGSRHANSVWTVKGSSDGVGNFNTSGSNLWAAYTNIIFAGAGVNHSWIWLENTTLGYQLVIDCINSDTSCVFAMTKTSQPFTGGSATARPSNASFEVLAGTTSTGNSPVTFISDQSAGTHQTHFVTADDGQFFFASSRTGAGLAQTFLALQKSVDGGAGDTHNVFWIFNSTTSGRGAPNLASITGSTAGCVAREPDGTTPTGGMWRPYFGGYDITGVSGGGVTDALTGKYNAAPCAVACSSAGQTAYRGKIVDMYHVGQANIGISIPSATSQERTIFGDFIIPMPGVAPLV